MYSWRQILSWEERIPKIVKIEYSKYADADELDLLNLRKLSPSELKTLLYRLHRTNHEVHVYYEGGIEFEGFKGQRVMFKGTVFNLPSD